MVTWSGAFVGSKDSYGFHVLEKLQSIVERRDGGETGITAVQCFENEPVWKWTDANPWAARLLDALARSPGSTQGSFQSIRDSVKEPILFVLEYRDGLRRPSIA